MAVWNQSAAISVQRRDQAQNLAREAVIMKIRSGIGLALPVLLLIGGGLSCGGSVDSEGRATAVGAVVYQWETPGPQETPPPIARDYECVIAGGGPYPGIRVPGTCRWDAERDSDDWIVSEKQTWRCEDFNANIEGKETCTGENGWHTWRYRVTAEGAVERLDDEGMFPPQLVE
jgi:hypothetical protein